LHWGGDIRPLGAFPLGRWFRSDDGGHFQEVVLRPEVVLESGSNPDTARRLHSAAHRECFIANSVNFPVRCEPRVSFQEPT